MSIKKKTSKSKEKKVSKRKSSEDEDYVQKPQNAYNIFHKEKRQETIDENPGAKHTEIFGLVAAKWKALSSSEKKVYEEKAKKDKERYEKECEEKGIEIKKTKKASFSQ